MNMKTRNIKIKNLFEIIKLQSKSKLHRCIWETHELVKINITQNRTSGLWWLKLLVPWF